MDEITTSVNSVSRPNLPLRPDTRGYFPIPSHEPVWNILRTATALGRGVILVLGDAGSGKTMMIHRLVNVLPDDREGVLLHHPEGQGKRFLRNLIAAIRPPGEDLPSSEAVEPTPDAIAQAVAIRAKHPRKLLLAVDDAHRLTPENLHALSLVLTHGDDEDQPVQLLLVGRPELMEVIQSSGLEQLTRAISGTGILTPLTRVEQRAYASHLLQRASISGVTISWLAWEGLHYLSQGLPGRINTLLNASLRQAQEEAPDAASLHIDARTFHRSALPLDCNHTYRRAWRGPALTAAILLVTLPLGFMLGRSTAPTQEKLVLVASSSMPQESASLTPPPPALPVKDPQVKPTAEETRHTPGTRVTTPAMTPPGIVLALSRHDPFPATVEKAEVKETSDQSPPPAPVAQPAPPPPAPPSTRDTVAETPPPAQEKAVQTEPKPEPPEPAKTVEKNAPKAKVQKNPPKEKPDVGPSYIVQAGAYGTREFASAVVVRLKALGYAPTIRETVKDGRRFHAVRIPFPDHDSAKKAADRIHEAEAQLPIMVVPPPAKK